MRCTLRYSAKLREDIKLIDYNPPDWSGAIIFLIIAIISVLSYWFMRKRFV